MFIMEAEAQEVREDEEKMEGSLFCEPAIAPGDCIFSSPPQQFFSVVTVILIL